MMLSRRRFVGGLAATSLAAPFVFRNASAAGLTKIVYQTAWTPEPDDGGLYQAVASGIYKSYGFDVQLQAGGPQLNSSQIFFSGQADFVNTDSFRALGYVKQNLPGVAVAAFYQKPPTVLLSHPRAGNDTLAELKGKPILISTGGREAYWIWLKAKYGYDDDQARPYTFTMAPFLVDNTLSMEGYLTIEPFQAQKAGVNPVVHVLADNGYLAYYNVMLASPRMVAENKAVVQRFVDATIMGWRDFLFGNAKPAIDAIKSGNPEMNDALIAYARTAMKRHALCDSDDVRHFGLGAMTDAKWKSIYASMAAVGALPAGIDPRKAYTLQFVNKRVGA
jgi:NitT/TauT family transport system substrate-binding protein